MLTVQHHPRHALTVALTFVTACGLSVLAAVPASAATVTVSGPANCSGYPAGSANGLATKVQIKVGATVGSGSVSLLGNYTVTMSNVPSGGENATATISCSNGHTWNLPFRLSGQSSTVKLDLTNPTPAFIGVHVDDPSDGLPVWYPNPPISSRWPWPLHVQIYNQNNVLVGTRTVTAQWVQGSDEWDAPAIFLGDVPSGGYYFKTWLDFTLHKQVDGIYNVVSRLLPYPTWPDFSSNTTQLIEGDINQDNQITSADFLILKDCYSDLLPPTGPCSATQKRGSDLTLDGHVNGPDYNLWLRIDQNVHGG